MSIIPCKVFVDAVTLSMRWEEVYLFEEGRRRRGISLTTKSIEKISTRLQNSSKDLKNHPRITITIYWTILRKADGCCFEGDLGF